MWICSSRMKAFAIYISLFCNIALVLFLYLVITGSEEASRFALDQIDGHSLLMRSDASADYKRKVTQVFVPQRYPDGETVTQLFPFPSGWTVELVSAGGFYAKDAPDGVVSSAGLWNSFAIDFACERFLQGDEDVANMVFEMAEWSHPQMKQLAERAKNNDKSALSILESRASSWRLLYEIPIAPSHNARPDGPTAPGTPGNPEP